MVQNSPNQAPMDLSLNEKFLFIFISAESETTSGISKSFAFQSFIFFMLKKKIVKDMIMLSCKE